MASPAYVSDYSLEIFRELKDEAARLDEHMTRVRTRVDVVAELSATTSDDVDVVTQQLRGHCVAARLPSLDETDRVLRIPEISFEHRERHPALVRAYDRCEAMPALERVRKSRTRWSGERAASYVVPPPLLVGFLCLVRSELSWMRSASPQSSTEGRTSRRQCRSRGRSTATRASSWTTG